MRKSLSPLFVCLITVITAGAQTTTNGRITGAIKDVSERPVDAATVSLLKAKDSSLVKISLSDKKGGFEFEKIADGKYLVSITAAGLSKAYGHSFELSSVNNTIDLGTFEMTKQIAEIGNVSVTAKRPLIENKIDRTVVNVESSITNAGNSALDVLEKSPGITVDNNGVVSLKGKQGVIILIDGKQTYLGGNDLVNYLRSLTAAQLDQIEIMSQPPAKYDASGNSGLINIKTKKGTQTGYNGSITLSGIFANYIKSPNSINMNYRKGKVNLFGQYSYTYWEGFNNINIERYFGRVSEKEFQSLFDQNSFLHFRSNTHSFRAGMDYFANKRTTLGFALNGTFNKFSSKGETSSDFLNKDYDLISYNKAFPTNEGPWKNLGLNLNFKTTLDKTGKELSADVDVVYYKNDNTQNSDNYNYNPDGTLVTPVDPILNPNPYLLRGHLPGEINIYTARMDYTQPLKEGAKFDAGWKAGYVKNDNDARYSYYLNGLPEKDTFRSNHFIYEENVNAAYINFSKQFKKWGIQTGLRMENTNVKGNQLAKKNQQFDTSYLQLFPTIYLSYAANKANNFTLSYSRRIDRPNYQDMNPFQFFLDQYTYRQGNPYLKPQTSHNVELSYNYKGQLTISANYTRTTDIINDVLKQNDSTRVTFQTKENVAERTNIGLSINYNKPLTKWWTIGAFANIFNNHFEGFVNNLDLKADIATYMINMNHQFKFNKGWGAEVSGFYRSKILASGLIIGEPMGVISFGGSKQILKGKGSIRLNLNDPFWLQYFRGYTKFGNIDTRITSRWDNRRYTVTFTWRFSKGQNQPQARRRAGSAQDEQNRIGQGGQQ
ncbi:MAG: TonB-dependent receptor [Chitinophagaceae bacterium]|nr:TonB-dependent receptor [Chitinophagaceae bacterium]